MSELDMEERAILKEDYDAFPDSAHTSRLHWMSERGDYKPKVVNGKRMAANSTVGGAA